MKGERGYTLIEALIAIAITGFLITVLGLAVQNLVTVPERGGDQVDAIHPLQNAAHWVALDGQMALSATGGSNLTLTLPNGSVIWYGLSGSDLYRYTSSTNQTIAEGITSANFTVQDKVIYMTIAAVPDSRWDISSNLTYRVFMRPTE
jgi:prepilin-type N-terminal cleavage/methylation domain-containing protein